MRGELYPAFSCRDSWTGLNVMNGLPITAAVCEVLPLLQQCLHQGTANTWTQWLQEPESPTPRPPPVMAYGMAPVLPLQGCRKQVIREVTPFLS